jgi:hypothetical protein
MYNFQGHGILFFLFFSVYRGRSRKYPREAEGSGAVFLDISYINVHLSALFIAFLVWPTLYQLLLWPKVYVKTLYKRSEIKERQGRSVFPNGLTNVMTILKCTTVQC